MPAHELGENAAEVGGDRQVTSFVALLAREAGPAAGAAIVQPVKHLATATTSCCVEPPRSDAEVSTAA